MSPAPNSRRAGGADDAGPHDLTLMRRAQAEDDHAAFTELAERAGLRLAAVLRATFGRDETDNALNTVLGRAWQYRRQYDPAKGPVLAWLIGIARNLARDARRSRQRAPPTVRLGGAALADQRATDPAAAAELADWAGFVRRCLDEVLAGAAPFVRTAWEMRLDEVPYAAIARATGRTTGTLASAVFRVRAKVLARIRNHRNPDPRKGDLLMPTDPNLKTVLHALHDLKDRQATLERLARQPADTAPRRADLLRGRLDRLLRDGAADPAQLGSAANWAEVLDLARELHPSRCPAPAGLFRRVWVRLTDARERLTRDPENADAVQELKYVVTILDNVGR